MTNKNFIEDKAVNELRVLSAEMITTANSGHPGIALGSAPIFYSLYSNILAVDAQDPKNIFRDRFVLSAGHGSSILYATLFAMGFDLTNDDLKNFRRVNSKTPGHPEVNITDGVDDSTGPLGQGIANAVGMAIAEKNMEATFNKRDLKLFDSKIYCLSGDGCLMEGISYEALSLAGTLNLNNFVLIYDYNKITIEGNLDIANLEDVALRFKAINFDVITVKNGNSTKEITTAITKAKKSKKPSIVIVPTVIGFGSDLEGTEKVHGLPLSAEQIENLKNRLDVSKPNFDLSSDVKKHFEEKSNNAKQRLFKRNVELKYKEKYPKEYKKLKQLFDFNYENVIQKIKKLDNNSFGATRDLNHKIMQEVAKFVPTFIGGSADVATSTKAYIESNSYFSKNDYFSRYIHYGIREHSMAGISNGIALFGGFLPYQSCFLSFMDYLKPAIRMSALMNLRVFSIFSHDSITAGQDGPTHQPIEQLPSLRLIPNTIVSRPYNASEILATYIWLMENKKPVSMLVSKDKYEYFESKVDDAINGGYTIFENKSADITLIGTGSDVDRCFKIMKILNSNGIECRIVSIPSISIFEEKTTKYKNNVLKDLPKVFVEASNEQTWYRFAGRADLVLGLNNFGASGSPAEVEKFMKFDANSLAKKILKWHSQKNKQM